jgi:hypothetical protein
VKTLDEYTRLEAIAMLAVYERALNDIACWGTSDRRRSSLDEPGAAMTAREALRETKRDPSEVRSTSLQTPHR